MWPFTSSSTPSPKKDLPSDNAHLPDAVPTPAAVPPAPKQETPEEEIYRIFMEALAEESDAAKVNQPGRKSSALPSDRDPNAIGSVGGVMEELRKDSQFPTEMNCLTAFDNMYYCYSLGGQFLNVYRYGTLKDCSEISADWRFCMRTKAMSEVEKKRAIVQRYREKAAKIKNGPSSEDIWDGRTEPLVGAFGRKSE